jgi:hypothetical protein
MSTTSILQLLNIGFLVFHTAIILFNMFGWVRKRWRKWHVLLVVLTALSWFAMGPIMGYGIGYCICTDWHWQVRRALGIDDGNISYIQLLFRGLGVELSTTMSNILAYGIFGFIIIATLVVNVRDWLLKRSLAAPR